MCAPFFVVIPFQLDAPEGDALDMLDHTPAPTLRTKQKSIRVHAPHVPRHAPRPSAGRVRRPLSSGFGGHAPHVPAMPRLRPGGKVLPSRGTR